MTSMIVRLRQLFQRPDSSKREAESLTLPLNPVTIRTQRINRGVEEGVERHSYRGNPSEDDKWPDQTAKT